MKNIICGLFALMAIITISITASAEAVYKSLIFDDAEILTYSEEEELLSLMENLSDRRGMNVCVVTSDNKNGKSSMEYADDYYDKVFGINTNGILLLLDNEDKIDWISTSGIALHEYYSDYAIEKIFDDFYAPLHENDFYGTIKAFIESCDTRLGLEGYSDGEEGFSFIPLLIGIFIGGIAVLIIIGTVSTSYKGKTQMSADHYMENDKIYYRQKSDIFVREYTTSVKVSSDSKSSGGGHSSHTSSSGGSHGGGGRSR